MSAVKCNKEGHNYVAEQIRKLQINAFCTSEVKGTMSIFIKAIFFILFTPEAFCLEISDHRNAYKGKGMVILASIDLKTIIKCGLRPKSINEGCDTSFTSVRNSLKGKNKKFNSC